MSSRAERLRFRGEIAGVGSTSGVRLVLGRWRSSPFGEFADAMVETATGHRVLIAPTDEIAGFVASTYSFDEVRVERLSVQRSAEVLEVRGDSLRLELALGSVTALGRLLGLVPPPIAQSPVWCAVTDPVARVTMSGVRTRGSAGNGRREWYAAHSARAIRDLAGSFDGVPLGVLAPVDPPCHFGFSSTPRRPTLTVVTTTIDLP